MALDPIAVLVRHAETEWSAAGRHTSSTDLPLTETGRDAARALRGRLERFSFALVLRSPLRRARETCELCGLGDAAQVRDDLHEWEYGEYEGLTTPQIHERDPDWSLWRDGAPGGESPSQVAARADAVVTELAALAARSGAADPEPGALAAVFAHGHILRVLGARWIAEAPAVGGRLYLGTASLSMLGYEHGEAVIGHWNDTGERIG